MPSFSPHAAAGNSICASTEVSVRATQSETTTSSQRRNASRARSAFGRLTTGLVAMIHTALMRPPYMASNISTALSPGRCARRGACQNCCTMSRWAALSKSMCAASMFAMPPTSRPPMALGCPVTENGPIPGRPIRPVSR